MVQGQPPQAPADDDVRIVEHHDPEHGWNVFFGRSSTPMHCTSVETARRAARQHARGHQVAVWITVEDRPDSRELLFDHRKPDTHGR